jgi:hypothetical protein
MSTARKRSVLIHSSSKVGGARVGDKVIEDVMGALCLRIVEMELRPPRRQKIPAHS